MDILEDSYRWVSDLSSSGEGRTLLKDKRSSNGLHEDIELGTLQLIGTLGTQRKLVSKKTKTK